MSSAHIPSVGSQSRHSGLLTALFALAVVLFVAEPSWASPPGADALPIHVVSVKSDHALNAAEALTITIQKAVRDSQGWSLADSKHSLEFLALKMQCKEPIDAACEARIAEVIKADRYLWCVIGFADDSKQMVSGTLNFFERGKGTNRVGLSYSANLTEPTADALIKVARNAVNKATGGPPKGGLKVQTGGVAGQLFVDDEARGALPAEGATIQLPSGPHTISVKARGYADAQSNVTIKPATTVDVTLTMAEVEEEKPIDGRMIGGFVSIGVGVAAGAVGLWAALDVNGIRNDETFTLYRDTVPSNQNACEVARGAGLGSISPGAATDAQVVEFCDRADTAELIQAITFPVAAVAVGVGAYLLGTSSLAGGGDDEGDKKSAVSVEPVIGPDVQALNVRYRF